MSIGANIAAALNRYKKLPKLNQLKNLWQVFGVNERIIFGALLFLFFVSGAILLNQVYLTKTELLPSPGGLWREGIVGQVRFINPMFASTDAEKDTVELLFSGLMGYNRQAQLVPVLAESYEIKEQGKIYEFILRDGLFWSDGQPLTANDVVWTIKALQDPSYKSPYLASWLDVAIEKEGDKLVRFRLKEPYWPFLELATVKILPHHIWSEIAPQNAHLSPFNLRPVSLGPFTLKHLEQDELGFIKSLVLEKNPNWTLSKIWLSEIKLIFFQDQKDLLRAAASGKLDGFALIDQPSQMVSSFKQNILSIPRYVAAFFNLQNGNLLNELKIRQAMHYAVNKKEIDKTLDQRANPINSPLLPELFGLPQPHNLPEYSLAQAELLLQEVGFDKINHQGVRYKVSAQKPEFEFTQNLRQGSSGPQVTFLQQCLAKDSEIYPEAEITGTFGSKTKAAVKRFQEKYADEILKPQGLSQGNGDVLAGTRKKLQQVCAPAQEQTLELKFTLVTIDQTQFKSTAQELKRQFKNAGIELEIKIVPFTQLFQEYLRPRNYDILLFGQVVGIIPDFYPFWHSKQRKDPGLNLSGYNNKKADELLVKIRGAKTQEEFMESARQLQEVILSDLPALVLYQPHYLYYTNPILKGFETNLIAEPSKRFAGVEQWYIKTRRALK